MHGQGLHHKRLHISQLTGKHSSLQLYSSHLICHSKEPPFFTFPKLSKIEGIVHAIFTRHGGVSHSPFDSLNVSHGVGDRHEDVEENLKRIRNAVSIEHLVAMEQVHGSRVVSLRKGDISGHTVIPDCDGLVTDAPKAALMVKQADCQGVILMDPGKGVLGMAHCGWRGNVSGILAKIVATMVQDFGCNPADLHVAIGPSLGPCCAEFVDYHRIFPEEFVRFQVKENHFDLWAISRWQLVGVGVKGENIEVAGICTKCRSDIFFSYRRRRDTGRFATVAMLSNEAP